MWSALRFIVLLLAVSFTGVVLAGETEDFTQHVDPYIGTGGHGHVFLGASVPFGAVQLGPSNFHQGWDWCSGYHYSDDVVIGFPHLHLSGTGIPDLGDILVMPYTGHLTTFTGKLEEPESGYASRYSHDQETARPGYYSVKLLDYDIDVELTATERVGVHRYRVPGGRELHIIIDLEHENGEGRAVRTSIRQVDEYTLVGSRFSTGWARDQRVYFAMKSSVPIETFQVFDGDRDLSQTKGEGAAIKGVISFAPSPREVMLKVGISPVSEENAAANIKAETPDWDFEKIVEQARLKWNDQLKAIRIKTSDEASKRVFYTALYHTMIAPVLFNDHNGDYRGTDKKVYPSADFTNYSIFSLWDTYRAVHPLFTLTQPDRVNDFVKSMLAIYEQQGKLPVWHLLGNETDTMIGYHAVPVIVDAYLKGYRDYDVNLAYEAIKTSAMREEAGLSYLKESGFIPAEKEVESVAKAMEYAIDDWCIAQMARALEKDDDYQYFMKRASYYKNYFDPNIQFMRGKLSDASWRTPFDPIRSTHRKDDYCEGNAWQYIWLVPHDVEGLIALFGSADAFVAKLDQLFSVESVKNEGASMDISGLIGQYAHGNEPGHHTSYLYAFGGKQWKTAERVRYIVTELYTDQPDGLSGNEDCGQMSAWYILSSMGMYPVNPAAGTYVFGSPLFDEAVIQLDENKTFTITAKNNCSRSKYIQSATLNGAPYKRSYITHDDIVAGGNLTFVMGPKPNKEFGAKKEHRPHSKVH